MSVKGFKELAKRFDQISAKIEDEIKFIVEDTTIEMQRDAIRNAPAAGDVVSTQHGSQKINTGINQFIDATFDKSGMAGEVFIKGGAVPLAIYIEFGTGISAAGYVPTLDPEFQEVAKKYYINGKGTLIKQPFMIPSWTKHSQTVVPSMKKAVKNIKL